MITSTSGLVGYYQGSMKAFLSYLEEMNKVKQDQQIENVIIGMKETLREGEEIWENVKMKL
jgi:hypothetical protein